MPEKVIQVKRQSVVFIWGEAGVAMRNCDRPSGWFEIYQGVSAVAPCRVVARLNGRGDGLGSCAYLNANLEIARRF